jgi:hypothetical protein
MNVEATRLTFRPARITTLFVGESAPVSGDFFYYGNTQMTRYMRRAFEQHFGPGEDFLARFKSVGWYLDDLVLTPVNQLDERDRKGQCLAARTSLAERISTYKPQAIVTLLHRIKDDVAVAVAEVGCKAPLHSVPFPGFGQQGRFHIKMIEILPDLPAFRTHGT